MPKVNDTFRWTERHGVNIEVIDRQHRQLLATINELDHALANGQGNATVETTLEKLVEYSQTHFSTEESLMEQHEFPGLAPHRAHHELFRRNISGFVEDYKARKPGVPVSLMLFIQKWMKEHILKVDKQFSGFLNARGVR